MKLLSIISNAMALEALKKSVACETLVPSIDILSTDMMSVDIMSDVHVHVYDWQSI